MSGVCHTLLLLFSLGYCAALGAEPLYCAVYSMLTTVNIMSSIDGKFTLFMIPTEVDNNVTPLLVEVGLVIILHPPLP